MNEYDTKVNSTLITKYRAEIEGQKTLLRKVKNVLRIPRLFWKFQELLKEITTEKQLEAYLNQKFY